MVKNTVHNPDRYMVDLRQILSQGKKRIGLLVGAGAPVALRVNALGQLDDEGGPIIPDVAGLTDQVIARIDEADRATIRTLLPDLEGNPNIETILTRIRRLSEAIGSAEIYGLNGAGYSALAGRICVHIGEIVSASLPQGSSPYTELVSWIGGTHRDHPVEVFTPNYDLLLEEAFERAHLPYFDGFTGSHRPFFDPTSISEDCLPPRWSRLWKIHGSLGWDISENTIIRTGNRNATQLIYPDHLKYDEISRQPYSALFERLREFLITPDSLLITIGFSYFDAHITAVLEEALTANSHTAILGFQFRKLDEELHAVKMALRRPNMSVYAQDGAVISAVQGKWQFGEPPSKEWNRIRGTFWGRLSRESPETFMLGDFAKLARFFALSQAVEFASAFSGKTDEQLEVVERETPRQGEQSEVAHVKS